MNSAEIRNEVIATVTNAILYPEAYGDRFFVQLVSSADRGFLPLTLIHGMIKELETVPLKYIEHCADKEPQRLQLSIDRTKIRIAGQYEDDPMDDPERETDAYGKQQQQQQTIVQDQMDTSSSTPTPASTPSSPSSFKTAPSSPVEEKDLEAAQNKPSKYFRPYIPSFTSKESITAPIYYNNGRFYNDAEELSKKVRQDRPTMEVPPYEKLEIDAIGDSKNSENMNVCWNCGKEDHSYSACPEPRDDAMIKEYRKRLKKNTNGPPNTGRFFDDLTLKNKIATLHPGRISLQLQEALGMNKRYPDPPYYLKMRHHGYPPGYWGTPKDKDMLLSRWKNPTGWSEELLFDDVQDLNIYMDAESYDQKQDEDNEGPVKSVGTNERVQLVHYPGLETWDEMRNHRHTTTTAPHLDYTYSPAYYLENGQPYSKPSRTTTADTTITATTTTSTAHMQTVTANEVYALPPPIPTPQQSQEQYYDHYYYQHPQQQYQQQPSVPYYPQYDYSQPVHSSILENPQLEQPVTYHPEKADEKMGDGESDMEISDDDD